METFFMTGNLLTVCLVFGIFLGYELRRKEMKNLRNELTMMKSRYRRAHGFHEWFGTYDLETFDGGLMWYAMKNTTDGGRIVHGEAEYLYPGLLSEHSIREFQNNSGSKLPEMKDTFPPLVDDCDIYRNHKDSLRIVSQFVQLERDFRRERVRKQSYCRSMPALRHDSNSGNLSH